MLRHHPVLDNILILRCKSELKSSNIILRHYGGRHFRLLLGADANFLWAGVQPSAMM